MNGWFPKINARGDIASGNTELWITYADGRQVRVVEHGGGAIWLTADSFIYNDQVAHNVIYPSGDILPGYNWIASNEAGQWAGATAAGVDVYHQATRLQSIPGAGAPKLFVDQLGYLTPAQAEVKSLIVNGAVVATGPIVDYVLTPAPVVMRATGTYSRAYDSIPTINPTEGGPIASDGWLLSNAGNREGLYLRPLNSVVGYFLPGEWYYPDFRKLGSTLIVAASTSAGDLKVQRIDTSAPRVDLTTIPVPGTVTPDPPIHNAKDDIPPHTDVPPATPMPTAPNRLSVVQSVIAAHPSIDRMTDGVRGQITDLVVKALGGVPWGRKEKIKGSGVLSDDALCYRLASGQFEIYDILSGADGSGTWDYKGTFADGENGFFFVVPVDASSGGGDMGSGEVPSAPGAQLDATIAALTASIKVLKDDLAKATARIAALEARPAGGGSVSLDGTHIALQACSGKYVCEDQSRPLPDGTFPLLANRDGYAAWETFIVRTV